MKFLVLSVLVVVFITQRSCLVLQNSENKLKQLETRNIELQLQLDSTQGELLRIRIDSGGLWVGRLHGKIAGITAQIGRPVNHWHDNVEWEDVFCFRHPKGIYANPVGAPIPVGALPIEKSRKPFDDWRRGQPGESFSTRSLVRKRLSLASKCGSQLRYNPARSSVANSAAGFEH